MGATRLSERLSAAAKRAGFEGKRSASRLHRQLRDRHGVKANLQSLLNWLSGARNPEPTNLRALLDALGVHGEERDEIVRLSLPEGLLSPNREDETSTGAA